MNSSTGKIMFCPKCGTQNPETNKFCRACRENLQVVAQAIKQTLPVLLVSKLDAAIDNRAERFRRDVFLTGLMYVGISLSFLFSSKVSLLVWISFTVLMGLGLRWDWLAYLHCLKLDSQPPLADQAKAFAFCPACGEKVTEAKNYCAACKTNLLSLREALLPNKRQHWFNSLLDRYVKYRSGILKVRQSSRMLPFGLLSVLFGIFAGVRGGDINAFFTFCSLGCFMTAVGLWDWMFYRRMLTRFEDAIKAAESNVTDAPTTNELQQVSTTNPLALPEANAASAASTMLLANLSADNDLRVATHPKRRF